MTRTRLTIDTAGLGEYNAGYREGAREEARPSITDDQINALLDEAGQAGDATQIVLCERALAGDEAARRECAEVIAATKAMAD